MPQFCSLCLGLAALLLLLLQLAEAEAEAEVPAAVLNFGDFEAFKAHHNKTYLRQYNEQRARKAFAANRLFIEQHNAEFEGGNRSFAVRANHLADLSNDQYMRAYVRLTRSHRRKVQLHANSTLSAAASATSATSATTPDAQLGSTATATNSSSSRRQPATARRMGGGGGGSSRMAARWRLRPDALPERFDWRERGFRTPVQNQKSCGACYAFAIALAVEGQVFRRTGQLRSLSAQQLLDCTATSAVGNHGCAGGSLRNTLRYVRNSGGLMRDEDYPYVAAQHQCDYNPRLAVARISSWDVLAARDEAAMQAAVAQIGPIAVSINASPKSFQLYSHGVYDDAAACSSSHVNHAMLVVGYTEDAWILKNWWGSRWGDGGYMQIARGKNMCGLANYVAYAVI